MDKAPQEVMHLYWMVVMRMTCIILTGDGADMQMDIIP